MIYANMFVNVNDINIIYMDVDINLHRYNNIKFVKKTMIPKAIYKLKSQANPP